MFQQHRISRVRRNLSFEALEDRTLLSGTATAVLDPVTATLAITMEGNSPGIQALQTTPGVLSVAPLPGTILNDDPTGTPVNFSLSSFSSISVVAADGSNQIYLGQNPTGSIIAGFSILGNIDIEVGNGVDYVVLNKITTPTGLFTFNGTHGSTPLGTDTVTMKDTFTGANVIIPGRGKLTLNQTNITTGLDEILATPAARGGSQLAADSITIQNSMFHPPPRIFAIGELVVEDGNASNSFFINSIDAGPASIVSGDGNNSLTFTNSTILTDTTILGDEGAAANGSNTLVMDHNTVVGQFVDLFLLNQSGISGSGPTVFTTNNVADGPNDGYRSQRHTNKVAFTNTTFTTAFPVATPQFFVQIDDADYYYDTQHGNRTNRGGGSFVATNDSMPGLASFLFGDHMEVIQLGQLGTVTNGIPTGTNTNIFTAGQLSLNAGDDLDTVILSANVKGEFIPTPFSPVPFILPAAETITLGDNTINPVQGTPFPASATNNQLTPPSVFTFGTVGTSLLGGNLTLSLGSNLSVPGTVNSSNAGEPLGWPVVVRNTVVSDLLPGTGNLSLVPNVLAASGDDNGLAVTVNSASVAGLLTISVGNGGLNTFEALTLSGITSVGTVLVIDSNVGDRVGITVADVAVTGSNSVLLLQEIGHGVDIIQMTNVAVAAEVIVLLSDSGSNDLSAQNVTAAFGFIDGGAGLGNHYHDLGGNSGYELFDFV